MSQNPQTGENYRRRDPLFHFVLVPLTLILLIWSGVVHFHLKTVESFFVMAAFFVLLLLTFKTRIYSLKVQDRVIRLEERLRLQALGNEALRLRLTDLTESQLIALRFASDAEAPALALKALDENMTSKQIKAAIQKWRGDYFRV